MNGKIEFPIYPHRKISFLLSDSKKTDYAWIGTESPQELQVFGLIHTRKLRYISKVLYEHFYGAGVRLTALRRGLALSVLFNVILLAVVVFTIGGR